MTFKLTGQSFKTMCYIYGKQTDSGIIPMDMKTFQKYIKSIRPRVDKLGNKAKGERYSKLNPNQVKSIVDHLGHPTEIEFND